METLLCAPLEFGCDISGTAPLVSPAVTRTGIAANAAAAASAAPRETAPLTYGSTDEVPGLSAREIAALQRQLAEAQLQQIDTQRRFEREMVASRDREDRLLAALEKINEKKVREITPANISAANDILLSCI